MAKKKPPTQREYNYFQEAFDHFNNALFKGELPNCIITLKKHKGSHGVFYGDKWKRNPSIDPETRYRDEISLNPQHFENQKAKKRLAALVHEMSHSWQFHHGTFSPHGYHNKQWAAKMKEIGLHPSNTGEPGGKEVGAKMTHYILEGGKFDKASKKLMAKETFYIPFLDRPGNEEVRKKKAASKTKYSCSTCGLNAWAKPETSLICGDCKTPLQAA